MNKFLLLPLCVSVFAGITSANAETQAVQANSGIATPSSYSSVWNAKIEDKMSSDAYYWKSKGAVEKAKSTAMDLEAKNIVKERGIEKLKNRSVAKEAPISNSINDFLGDSILDQKLTPSDSASQEKSLLSSARPEASIDDKKFSELKKRQDLFIKQMTGFVNKKLSEQEQSKKVAPVVMKVPDDKEVKEAEKAKSDSEDGGSDFKFKTDKAAAVVVTSISARIVDIRKGFTSVMFAITNTTNTTNTTAKGGKDGVSDPVFMKVDIHDGMKTVPVTVDFGKTFDVTVKSYSPTSIDFEYDQKTFSAHI